ncbi:MAG: riboflavin synthase [bacterium]|nr:riboflavin synthase [bacterium]MDE0234627.1 riboflavin synthase [bacterium]
MFTGIVAEVGRVMGCEETDRGSRLTIEAPGVTEDLEVGDSVAVNGICLTAVAVEPPGFRVEAVAETLSRTNLGEAVEGSSVNLERPVRLGGRLDGHVVQGHVDGVGVVLGIQPEGDSRRVALSVPEELERYLVYKGSVAVDGVALTVTAVTGGSFEVALIPHTLASTTLGSWKVGNKANIEVDILAKYVEKLLVIRT